jgi:hypothetical protein
MKLTRNTFLLIALAFVVFVYFGNQGTLPKEAVADIQGKACAKASDCPCIGTYNYGDVEGGPSAIGIGVGQCTNGACDMGYCVGLEPVGTWMKDNPLHFLKDNPIWLIAGLAIVVAYFTLPKN